MLKTKKGLCWNVDGKKMKKERKKKKKIRGLVENGSDQFKELDSVV